MANIVAIIVTGLDICFEIGSLTMLSVTMATHVIHLFHESDVADMFDSGNPTLDFKWHVQQLYCNLVHIAWWCNR